ncbi:MAG: hypothetical protein AAGH99_10345 [Planctomycetota bacterium]
MALRIEHWEKMTQPFGLYQEANKEVARIESGTGKVLLDARLRLRYGWDQLASIRKSTRVTQCDDLIDQASRQFAIASAEAHYFLILWTLERLQVFIDELEDAPDGGQILSYERVLRITFATGQELSVLAREAKESHPQSVEAKLKQFWPNAKALLDELENTKSGRRSQGQIKDDIRRVDRSVSRVGKAGAKIGIYQIVLAVVLFFAGVGLTLALSGGSSDDIAGKNGQKNEEKHLENSDIDN